MKILLYADPHVCKSLSIVRGRGKTTQYSYRLEMLINTFKWISNYAKENNIEHTICLGDLADNNFLSAEEISAIKEFDIDNHTFLVGNHDMSDYDGVYNVANIFEDVINNPTIKQYDDFSITYLPYSSDIKDLYKLCDGIDPNRNIVLSHNDIKGTQYGNIECKIGYEFSDILQNSRLFVNGHIHTGRMLVKDRIYNLGALSGMNFNQENREWNPSVMVINTDTMQVELVENPFAMIFTKIDATAKDIVSKMKKLDDNKDNVVQLRIPVGIVEIANTLLEQHDIKFKRVITYNNVVKQDDELSELITESVIRQNIYTSLKEFMKIKYTTDPLLDTYIKEIERIEEC